MMRPSAAFLVALTMLLTALCTNVLADSTSGPAFVVIVNPSNAATTIDETFVADSFLKKVTHWPNESMIRPVDLVSSSPVRHRFTEDILRRSVEAVKGYWQQRIFSGRDVPPPEMETDDEVIRYVLKYEGAIGYVSPGARLNGSKVVTVR